MAWACWGIYIAKKAICNTVAACTADWCHSTQNRGNGTNHAQHLLVVWSGSYEQILHVVPKKKKKLRNKVASVPSHPWILYMGWD